MKIPVIDIADISLNQEEVTQAALESVAEELDDAFVKTGFVYLRNHGFPGKLVEDMFKVTKEFFLLPMDVKMKYNRKLFYNGYVPPNREMLDNNSSYRAEVREAYDIEVADGLFPDDELPEFRTKTAELLSLLEKLTFRLLRALTIALQKTGNYPKLSENYLMNAHTRIGKEKNATSLRTLYYPPLEGTAEELRKKAVGRLGEHSDYGTFTLLFQDSIGGLEVASSDGTWVQATPIPGTILVNVADMVQAWSAGRYPATLHRVRIPDEENRLKCARQSIVYFVHPDDEVMIEALDNSGKYTPISALDYLNKRLSETYIY